MIIAPLLQLITKFEEIVLEYMVNATNYVSNIILLNYFKKSILITIITMIKDFGCFPQPPTKVVSFY